MNELVKIVAQKTGLSEDMARKAVEMVVSYLKGKLPGAVGSQLDGVLGGAAGGGDLADMAKGLGGLLGNK